MDIRTITKELQANKRALEPKVKRTVSMPGAHYCVPFLLTPPFTRNDLWCHRRQIYTQWRVLWGHSELNLAPNYCHSSTQVSRQRYVYVHTLHVITT